MFVRELLRAGSQGGTNTIFSAKNKGWRGFPKRLRVSPCGFIEPSLPFNFAGARNARAAPVKLKQFDDILKRFTLFTLHFFKEENLILKKDSLIRSSNPSCGFWGLEIEKRQPKSLLSLKVKVSRIGLDNKKSPAKQGIFFIGSGGKIRTCDFQLLGRSNRYLHYGIINNIYYLIIFVKFYNVCLFIYLYYFISHHNSFNLSVFQNKF